MAGEGIPVEANVAEEDVFTPRNREKMLPPSPLPQKSKETDPSFTTDVAATSSPFAAFYSPMQWSTPRMDSLSSPSLEKPLPTVRDSFESLERQVMESHSNSNSPSTSFNGQQHRFALQDTSYDSPIESFHHRYTLQSNGSQPSDSSTRFSSSTLASSTTRTISDASTATSPSAYGFAFGSPSRDKEKEKEKFVVDSTTNNETTHFGLGLSEREEKKEETEGQQSWSGPFQHHRTPSWTMLNSKSSNVAVPPTTTSPSSLPHPPLTIQVPPRGASRSNSSTSNNAIRMLKKKSSKSAGFLPSTSSSPSSSFFHHHTSPSSPSGGEELTANNLPLSRPGTARSMSTNSITSSTVDSCSSRVSPRTSSLKRTKSRPALLSKGSESALSQQQQYKPRQNSNASRSRHGSSSFGGNPSDPTAYPLLNSINTAFSAKGEEQKQRMRGEVCSLETLENYLAITVPDDFLFTNEGEMSEEFSSTGRADQEKGDNLVFGNNQSLNEIKEQVGPLTTHLVLSGCRNHDEGEMMSFLQETLPIIGPRLLVLDVSNTGLTRIPNSLTFCPCLEELNISSNPIRRPFQNQTVLVKSLLNLRVLLADECQITMLPREMGELQSLKTLSLRRNNLSHLPSWLHRLTHLERLSLEGNPFQGAWQRICNAFVPLDGQATGVTKEYRPDLVRNVVSAPGRVIAFSSSPTVVEKQSGSDLQESLTRKESSPSSPSSSSFEELEEIVDHVPKTAPFPIDSLRLKEENKSFTLRRPFRRMLSGNGDSSLTGSSPYTSSSTTPIWDDDLNSPLDGLSESRRPSLGAESIGEKKWGSLMRKLGKKASTTTLVASSSSASLETSGGGTPISQSGASSPERKFSNAKTTCPLTPVGWQDGGSKENGSLNGQFGEQKKRSTYLFYSQDQRNVAHRRKLRALMQYLEDLDDLSAMRVGPPGSVLPMDTSMASRYSTPATRNSTTLASKEKMQQQQQHQRVNSEASPESSLSGHSSLESSDQLHSSLPSESAKDDAQRRVRIIQEIIATEESYIRGLKELVDIYVVPSAALDASSGQSMIPSTERRKVFGNVEGILHFHQGAFLPALQSAAHAIINVGSEEMEEQQKDEEGFKVMSASVVEEVATVFSKHSAFFRMYSSYVNNVDASQARVSLWKVQKMNNGGVPLIVNSNNGGGGSSSGNLLSSVDGSAAPNLSPKERKRIKTFLQRARADSRHNQLSLETYLHLPVQRIPRYRLLFEDLVRNCPIRRLKEPTSISSALESIRSIATLMNESKRQSENDRRLLEWQVRIRGNYPSPLVQPHRRLIRDGNLTLKRVVMRTTAFHMSKSQLLEEEADEKGNREWIESDGAVTNTDLGIVQVDCLDQQCMEKKVNLLLCNDITIVVVKDQSPQNGQVDLFAVLRIKGAVEIIGQTTLRVVDPKHILYFTASSPDEAMEWKMAMTAVNQQPRPQSLTKKGTTVKATVTSR